MPGPQLLEHLMAIPYLEETLPPTKTVYASNTAKKHLTWTLHLCNEVK